MTGERPGRRPRADEPARVVDGLDAARRELWGTGPRAGAGWCRAHSDLLDAALVDLAAPAAADGGLAIAAVGGYGRRELAPHSDVDLLLLHDRLAAPALERCVRRIVYPLWDAGLQVGYAVRDRREALDATDDLASATATLELRTVAGDDALATMLRFASGRRLRRRPEPFLRALRDADLARRARAGDAAEQLAPDLKAGAGGLRDVQSLRWASAALVGAPGLDPLVAAGYLSAADRPRLVRAERRLLGARVALHLEAGRGDVLHLDTHQRVARRLGHGDGEADVHRMLTGLLLAARTIDHVHRRAWALLDADLGRGARRRHRPAQRHVDGFELVDGVLRLPRRADFDAGDLACRLLAALVDTGAVLDRETATRLRRRGEAPGVAWRWTDEGRRRALTALWQGGAVLRALAELDDAGVLTAMLPGWAPLRGRAQRNPYHRFALDRHAWHAVAELGELVRREPWASEALAEVDDADGLVLGTLLHDVGKVLGEPHSETGVPLARELAATTGAPAATVELVGRLTRLHLLLGETARRRDVADPAVAREVAAAVGDRSTLACLHLLSAADGRATGPGAWSWWTASLVGRLVARVGAVLDDRDPSEAPGGAVPTARGAQRLAAESGVGPETVRGHLAMLPRRYPASVSPGTVVAHARLAADPADAAIRTTVTPVADDADAWGGGLDRLDVVAADRAGWLATVVGVLARRGGRIVAVDAFTRADGVAVSSLHVERASHGDDWWPAVEDDLAAAAAGRLGVPAPQTGTQPRAERRRLARAPAVPTEVLVEPDPSSRATVVQVRALDRPGLLHAIVDSLARAGADVTLARVQTRGHEAVDVFHLRGPGGVPLDADRHDELRRAVSAAVAALASDVAAAHHQ